MTCRTPLPHNFSAAIGAIATKLPEIMAAACPLGRQFGNYFVGTLCAVKLARSAQLLRMHKLLTNCKRRNVLVALISQLFRGDAKLEAAAASDPDHIFQGAKGPHVAKIQQALIQLDGSAIAQDSSYGPGTAAAVRAFKTKRQILNFQGKIDDIVGKKTMAALDAETRCRLGRSRPPRARPAV